MRVTPIKTADEFDELNTTGKLMNLEPVKKPKIRHNFNRKLRRAIKITIKAGIDKYTQNQGEEEI